MTLLCCHPGLPISLDPLALTGHALALGSGAGER